MEFKAQTIPDENGLTHWVEGFLTYSMSHTAFLIKVCRSIAPTWHNPGGDHYEEEFEINHKTLLRSTGVETEDRELVYEGDRVEFHYFYDNQGECENTVTGQVVWLGTNEDTGGLIGCFALKLDNLSDFKTLSGERDFEEGDMYPIPFWLLSAHDSSFTIIRD